MDVVTFELQAFATLQALPSSLAICQQQWLV